MTFSNGYKKLTIGYFELKLHKYMLGTPETNITSCKKGHNRCPLRLGHVMGWLTNELMEGQCKYIITVNN